MKARHVPELIFIFLDDPADIQFVTDLWKSKQRYPSTVKDEDVPLIKIKWDHKKKQFYFSGDLKKLELIKYLDNQSNIIIYGHGINIEYISCLRFITDLKKGIENGKLMTFSQLSDLIKGNVMMLTTADIVSDSRLKINLHICKAASDSSTSNPSLLAPTLNSFAECLHKTLNSGTNAMKTTMYAHQDNFYIIVDNVSKTVIQGSSEGISSNDCSQRIQNRLIENKSSEVIFFFNENNEQVVVKAIENPTIALRNQQKICQKYLINSLNQIAKEIDNEGQKLIEQFIKTIPHYECLNDIIGGLKQLLTILTKLTADQNTTEFSFTSTISSFVGSLFKNNPLIQFSDLIHTLENLTIDFKNAPFNESTIAIYISVSRLGQPIENQNQLIELLNDVYLTGYFSHNDLMQKNPVDQFNMIAAAKGENSYQSVIKWVVPKECLEQLMVNMQEKNSKCFIIGKPNEQVKKILLSAKFEALAMKIVKPQLIAGPAQEPPKLLKQTKDRPVL